jgi:1,4-dihydroxy-2-naphthoyl-CoA synthase
MAIKMLKFAMNLTDDGMVGQQVLQVKPHDWPI